jgi:hypothetical protein
MLVTGSQARAGVQNCMKFYNHRRPHKALGGRTPAVVNSLSSRNPNPIGRSRSELKRRRNLSREWGLPQLGFKITKHSVYKSRGTSDAILTAKLRHAAFSLGQERKDLGFAKSCQIHQILPGHFAKKTQHPHPHSFGEDYPAKSSSYKTMECSISTNPMPLR